MDWSNMRKGCSRWEPVGGRAVDVDQVADAALTFSCLLPEQPWHKRLVLRRVNFFQYELSPVATHHHQPVIDDGDREVGARLKHIGHLSFEVAAGPISVV